MWSFYFSHVRLTFRFWVTAKSFGCQILGGGNFIPAGNLMHYCTILVIFQESSCSRVQAMLCDEPDEGSEWNFRGRGSVVRSMFRASCVRDPENQIDTLRGSSRLHWLTLGQDHHHLKVGVQLRWLDRLFVVQSLRFTEPFWQGIPPISGERMGILCHLMNNYALWFHLAIISHMVFESKDGSAR
jgi:hypothetical protein